MKRVTAIRVVWAGLTIMVVSACAEGVLVPMIDAALLRGDSLFERLMIWLTRDHRGGWIGGSLTVIGAYQWIFGDEGCR